MELIARDFLKVIGKRHLVCLGTTGKGKSGFQRHLARAIIADPREGMTFIDPHGEAVRDTVAWCANPKNKVRRRIHVMTPGSEYSFSINPFQTETGAPQECHEAARQWASIVISFFHALPGQLPRLERVQHALGYLAAEKNLTVLDLPALVSLGGHYVRDRIIAGCSNPLVAAEWAGLAELAHKKPGQFFEQVESSVNRIFQWVTSPLLARIFGRPQGIPARKIMDERDIVLIDLSPLPDVDASFGSKCILSTYLTAAKQRPPHASPTHRMVMDECENSLCIETAKVLDQARKYDFFIAGNLQRLEQLRAREDGETIFDAVMSNCTVKVLMGMLNPESARYCAELFFTGSIDYAEEKPGSERPVAVGSDLVTLRNWSSARSHAEIDSHGESDVRAAGYATGAISASMSAAGATFGSGDSTSFASTPPQGILEPPMPTGQNKGRNNSRALATSRAASRATSLSRHQMRARARTHAHASSDTSSQSEGEAEAYVTRYEWLPGFYTLEEQLHRLTGEILNQPPRECFVKIDESKPYRARTADLEPAFRSAAFRDLMLPLFLENAARNSRYLIPAAQADAEIAARLAALNEPPSPDETNFAEPERADDNFVDAPFRSASRFHERLSDLGRGLRLVDGGKKDVHK